MRTGRRLIRLLAMALLLALGAGALAEGLYGWAAVGYLPENCLESPDFRALRLSESCCAQLLERCGQDWEAFGAELTAAMAAARFDLGMGSLPGEETCRRVRALLLRYRPETYRELKQAYITLFSEEQVFPVPDRAEDPREGQTAYEDSWMAPRSYGGERSHEGTDIFGALELPGYYPVLSMTAGTVERKGWLPLGGWRIGVRSDRGVYYYYAHLDSYARDFREGERVEAGELLGFLGDSGYGPEGTRGKFTPHLHLGIYLRTEEKPELSVNPYYLLRSCRQNLRRYRY